MPMPKNAVIKRRARSRLDDELPHNEFEIAWAGGHR
jgi:hypothetical protein